MRHGAKNYQKKEMDCEAILQTNADSAARWIPSMRSRRVDLVGDFTGPELVVVDGDAVIELTLRRVWAMTRETGAFVHPLVALYVAEQFVARLISAGVNLVLCFFADRRNLADLLIEGGCGDFDVGGECAKFTRAVVLHHLKGGVRGKVPVKEFESITSEEWSFYVLAARPYVMLTSDGLHHKLVAVAQAFVMNHCLSGGEKSVPLALALISDDMFINHTVVTFVCSPRALLVELAAEVYDTHQRMNEEVIRLVHGNSSPPKWEFSDSSSPDAFSDGDRIAIDIVRHLSSHASSETTDENIFFFLLHASLLPILTLRDRTDSSSSASMSGSFKCFLRNVMKIGTTIVEGSSQHMYNCTDNIDPILIAYLVTHQTQAAQCIKSPRVMERLIFLSHESGFKEALLGVLTALQSKPTTVSNTPNLEVPSLIQGLLPYAHPVLDDNMPRFDDAVFISHLDSTRDLHGGAEITYEEQCHWHSSSLLGSMKKSEREQRLKSGRKSRYTEKGKQKQAHWISLYAASLTGAKGGILVRQTVTVDDPSTKTKKLATSQDWSGSQKSKKPSKKDLIIEKNRSEKAEGEEKTARNRMLGIFQELNIGAPSRYKDETDLLSKKEISKLAAERKSSLEKLQKKAAEFFSRYDSAATVHREFQIMTLRISIEGFFYAHECKDQEAKILFGASAFELATSLLKMLSRQATLTSKSTTESSVMAEICQGALEVMGLESAVKDPPVALPSNSKHNSSGEYSLPFKFKLPKASRKRIFACSA
ncbi:hypothetical protein BJ741DRAFT_714778, partial [Chytriomyces cf. hyalinus JEL632]